MTKSLTTRRAPASCPPPVGYQPLHILRPHRYTGIPSTIRRHTSRHERTAGKQTTQNRTNVLAGGSQLIFSMGG
ncbi:MAG: hypothetical protein PHZ02_16360 [Desulfocapsaceae bacterium]|nr:hypothetical protein [Desulfocapsaceae bacterium]